jgi:hypothetical protein
MQYAIVSRICCMASQSDSANEKQGEAKVIAVVLLILLGQKIRGRELRHGGICATD